MQIIAGFVQSPYYVAAVALVVFLAVFRFVLNHENSLLLPYIASAVLIIAISTTLRVFLVFLISVPSMAVGLIIHLWLAAKLSYPLRRMIGRYR